MKTKYLAGWLLLVLTVASCTTNYRMVTRVQADGSVEKDVYALADSFFMAGDVSHNPFLFSLDNGWKVERFDSVMKFNFWGKEDKLNVKVSRTLNEVRGTLDFFSAAEKVWMTPLATPLEKLEKKFRWFYTYYVYTVSFKELVDKGPVPLDNYLDKTAQKMLFQGDMSAYDDRNGIELKNELDDLAARFSQWLYRSQYELSYKVVEHFMMSTTDDLTLLGHIQVEKDSIFAFDKSGKEPVSIDPEELCTRMDAYYRTTVFSTLYKTQKGAIDQMYEKECAVSNLFGYQIRYELLMPGEIITANTRICSDSELIWKIDAYRLLSGDYVLTAESRILNIWAFVVAAVLVAFAAYCIFRIRRIRRGA